MNTDVKWSLVANSTKYGPVLFSKDVNVQSLEKKGTVRPTRVTTVLMTAERFEALYNGTHSGAFGSDYGVVHPSSVPKDVFRPVLSVVQPYRVWFVYKFPWDMFGASDPYLPNECSIGIPLPVGTYPLWPDKWFISAQKKHPDYMTAVDIAIEQKSRSVTKMRTTLKDGSVFSILRETTDFPMVNNVPFNTGGLWEVPSKADQRKMIIFATECFFRFQLLVYPVWGQHHASMVFHAYRGTELTPGRLLCIVDRESPELGAFLVHSGLVEWLGRLREYVSVTDIEERSSCVAVDEKKEVDGLETFFTCIRPSSVPYLCLGEEQGHFKVTNIEYARIVSWTPKGPSHGILKMYGKGWSFVTVGLRQRTNIRKQPANMVIDAEPEVWIREEVPGRAHHFFIRTASDPPLYWDLYDTEEPNIHLWDFNGSKKQQWVLQPL
jgi:hypothetical protein